MSARLSLTQIAVLLGYALGMTGGQMLFKLAALRLPQESSAADRALSLLQDGYFLVALAVYLILALVWVWILSFTPLSRAYPFVAFAFVLTPVLGGLMFGEALSVRLFAGIAVILLGLLLVAG
jgi:drug/metabolite transporter (DMT)-like permease